MKAMNKLSCILLLIITSYLVSPSACDSKTEQLINEICGQTSDSGFCSGLLFHNLVSPITNLTGLTKLTIDISLSYAEYIHGIIQKSQADVKDPKLRQCYDVCGGNYQQVVGFMESAKYDFDRGVYGSMLVQLELCNRPIIDCQNAIGDFVLGMLEKNMKMRVLLSMGLYEARQLS
ncbi:hypothetical protein OROHE_018508 [Orobanche hederae]